MNDGRASFDVRGLTWKERKRLNVAADRALHELNANFGRLLARYNLSADALEREISHGGESFEPARGDDWRGF